jgi:hypothetical protein
MHRTVGIRTNPSILAFKSYQIRVACIFYLSQKYKIATMMQKTLIIAILVLFLFNLNYLSIIVQGDHVPNNKYFGGIFSLTLMVIYLRQIEKTKIVQVFSFLSAFLMIISLYFYTKNL